MKLTRTKFFGRFTFKTTPRNPHRAGYSEARNFSVLAKIAKNMVEVQGPQGVHNPHRQIDHLQQASPKTATITSEVQKLWHALQSQEKKSSAGNPGFCWYHERFGVKATKCQDPCTLKASSGNNQASQ